MSLPVWTALTAVTAGKLVSKVTTDGTAWYATTTGTTGAVQPTWPTNEPWTVADGSTAWALDASMRTMTRAGVVTILTNFRTANPNLLKGVAAARPKSMTNFDLPGVYIASIDETDAPRAGIQMFQRSFTGLAVMVVDVVPDNIEAEARRDPLVDGLIGAFVRAYHGIDARSILEASSVTDIPFDEGGVPYLATLISLGGTFKTEGVTL